MSKIEIINRALLKLGEPPVSSVNDTAFGKSYEMIYEDEGNLPSGDLISRKLIESSKKYNMLNKDKIDIKCPIRIIHGLKDELVPYEYSLKFSEKVESQDVKLYIEKNMNHNLTIKNNLDCIVKVVEEFINELK